MFDFFRNRMAGGLSDRKGHLAIRPLQREYCSPCHAVLARPPDRALIEGVSADSGFGKVKEAK